MCHHRGHDREWTTASEPLEADEDDETEDEPGLPSFLNETTAEDVDVLTDGGDEA